MTRDKFVKYKFYGYMVITFNFPPIKKAVDCMLISINYDTEILTLRQFPNELVFVDEEFHAHISHCEIGRPKLKVLK